MRNEFLSLRYGSSQSLKDLVLVLLYGRALRFNLDVSSGEKEEVTTQVYASAFIDFPLTTGRFLFKTGSDKNTPDIVTKGYAEKGDLIAFFSNTSLFNRSKGDFSRYIQIAIEFDPEPIYIVVAEINTDTTDFYKPAEDALGTSGSFIFNLGDQDSGLGYGPLNFQSILTNFEKSIFDNSFSSVRVPVPAVEVAGGVSGSVALKPKNSVSGSLKSKLLR